MRIAAWGIAQFFLFHIFQPGLVRKAISGGLPNAVGSRTLASPRAPRGLGKCNGVRMVSEAEKNGKLNYDIKSGLDEIQKLPTCETEMRDSVLR